MNYKNLKMIVCVGEDNLIGDKNPKGNGMLWHSLEELNYFKSITMGNVLLFGSTTAKFVPIELMKKTRDIYILNRTTNIDEILEKYVDTDKQVFVCGGATIYEKFLKNYVIDEIYLSKIKPHIEVEKYNSPLFFPKLEDYGYRIIKENEYNDFIAYVYKKQ